VFRPGNGEAREQPSATVAEEATPAGDANPQSYNRAG
jgi:hypothetical protein